MVYPNLKFPKISHRPFFYTNFVATLDGKVGVKKKGYWPIGSSTDHRVLLELRSRADCLVHGGNLTRQFGEITLRSLTKYHPGLPYWVITNQPESLKNLSANIVSGDLQKIVSMLKRKGYKQVLIEGGPTLLASFLREDLLDEIFLTISPKIFGNDNKSTLTLVEGYLFPPAKVKKFKLISVKKLGDEVFLRYRKTA